MFLLDTISEFILFTFPIRMVSYPSWIPSYHRSWCPDEWWRNLCVSSRSKSPTECRYLRETCGWSGYGTPYYLPVSKYTHPKAGNRWYTGRRQDWPDRIPSHWIHTRQTSDHSHHFRHIPKKCCYTACSEYGWHTFASSTADLQNYRDKLRDGWAHYHVHTVP